MGYFCLYIGKLLDKKEPLIDFLLLPTSTIISVRWTDVADKEAL